MRALLALLLLSPLLALGQYPAKPLRMVIPFPPGGATDIIGRVVAQKMAERLGQGVVVDNRPGAGGTIGAELVAKSTPDGYTILVATNSTHAVAAVLSKPPYDPLRDFTPIALLADSPNILVISPRLGIASVKELIAAAKAKPGTLSFASSGNGTIIHLTGEMFKQMAGVDMLHVPYKGTALSIPDLASGRVSILFDNIVSAQPHLRAGTVKALAVTSKARSALMPELPTMSEAGVAGFDSTAWFALFGPAGLPAEIRARLHEAAVAAVKAPDARERLAAAGAEISGAGGDELASLMRGDIAKWGRVVKTGNIKAE
ncbi:MAG: tripartite tricarboxylate transporter substrate binding protein [Betaproteobacteria bacterium]|nr:MAG: tripartite tricarboxylate transporter substrate binding protein [Betaproteobacteria bacterium]